MFSSAWQEVGTPNVHAVKLQSVLEKCFTMNCSCVLQDVDLPEQVDVIVSEWMVSDDAVLLLR